MLVASFPIEMNAVFEKGFEELKTGVDVEIIKNKTFDGVKYLKETRENNHADLFQMSLPDTFEILQKN